MRECFTRPRAEWRVISDRRWDRIFRGKATRLLTLVQRERDGRR